MKMYLTACEEKKNSDKSAHLRLSFPVRNYLSHIYILIFDFSIIFSIICQTPDSNIFKFFLRLQDVGGRCNGIREASEI